MAIDTEETALLGVLPSCARDDDEISRPSWMHRLQFHGLQEKHEEVSDYFTAQFKAQLTDGHLSAAYESEGTFQRRFIVDRAGQAKARELPWDFELRYDTRGVSYDKDARPPFLIINN